MEELRSTEILDKEIEADARKKAEKILKNAASECEQILSAVDTRVKEAIEQKSEQYRVKISRFEQNVVAALPLEKERFLISFYDESLSEAFNTYFEKLGSEKRLALLERKLAKIKETVAERRFSVTFFGVDSNNARRMLEKQQLTVLSLAETRFETSGEEAFPGNAIHEGLILESEDKKIRIRLTTDQIVRELEDAHNYELAAALFGGTLPS